MKYLPFVFLGLLVTLMSCRKDNPIADQTFYHVIIVAGQSNTHYGLGFDIELDAPDASIMQFGRHNARDYKIVQAAHPLDHHTRIDSSIGFSMTFAKLYLKDYVLKGEKILIIPCGKAGSSFIENNWRVGGSQYQDLIDRVNYVQSAFPNNELKAILWHQGESDIKNSDYEKELDAFIGNIRTRIGHEDLPFILGGMVPNWVSKEPAHQSIQNIIRHTPERVDQTGYANPDFPFKIEKELNLTNQIHYNAKGLRELGRRYYSSYQSIE